MSDDAFHLAQLNIARLLAPIDSPQIADFVASLDRINELAEASPGFVWRMKDDGGDATAIAVFTLAEAVERLEHLREHGPSPHAFTIRTSWPAPGPTDDTVTDDRRVCQPG